MRIVSAALLACGVLTVAGAARAQECRFWQQEAGSISPHGVSGNLYTNTPVNGRMEHDHLYLRNLSRYPAYWSSGAAGAQNMPLAPGAEARHPFFPPAGRAPEADLWVRFCDERQQRQAEIGDRQQLDLGRDPQQAAQPPRQQAGSGRAAQEKAPAEARSRPSQAQAKPGESLSRRALNELGEVLLREIGSAVTRRDPPPQAPTPGAQQPAIPGPTAVYTPPPMQAPVYAPPPMQAPVYAPPPMQTPVHTPAPAQAPVYAPPPMQAPAYATAPMQAPVHTPAPMHAPAPPAALGLIPGDGVDAHPTLQHVAQAVRGELARGNVPKAIAVTREGGWLLVHGRNGFAAQGVPDLLTATLTEVQRAGEEIKSVALTPAGGFIVVRNVNEFWAQGVSQSLVDKLQEYGRANAEVKSVVLSPDGGWVVLSGRNSFHTDGVPQALLDALWQFHRAGEEIQMVAFLDDEAWLVLGGGRWHGEKVPPDLANRLTALASAGIQAGAFADGRWIVTSQQRTGAFVPYPPTPQANAPGTPLIAAPVARTGELMLPGGFVYRGDLLDEQPNGNGTMTWPNGDRYTGQWVKGQRHGRGAITFAADGVRYEGDWGNDRMSGRGVMTWPNGERYEGDMAGDRHNGRGVYIWPDGSRYEGDFRENLRHGRGVLQYANGRTISGAWANDKPVVD